MSNTDVSIILVTYNTQELTLNCLNSIYEKTKDINFDVWVVDNNSSDNTVNAIKEKFPQVNLIQNKINLGFGSANNCAIKQSQAKYIFLLNTDTELKNNAVKILFDYMEENPQTGAAGGNLYDSEDKNVHSYGYFQTFKSKMVKTFHLYNMFPKEKEKLKDKGENQEEIIKEVEIIVGADLFLRKSVLDKIGLFDEDFFLYDEESELQFRLKQTGYKIFINPNAKIFHYEGKSSKDKISSRKYKMVSEILFYKKCYGSKFLWLYKIICCIPNIIRLLFHPKIIINTFNEIRKI